MDPTTVIGSVGVALLLLAFFLSLFKFIPQDSAGYKWMNLVGAGLSGYASLLLDFLPFVILEGTWAAVAAVSLFVRRR